MGREQTSTAATDWGNTTTTITITTSPEYTNTRDTHGPVQQPFLWRSLVSEENQHQRDGPPKENDQCG